MQIPHDFFIRVLSHELQVLNNLTENNINIHSLGFLQSASLFALISL